MKEEEVKAKRVYNEKQLKGLEEGRRKGLEKIKEQAQERKEYNDILTEYNRIVKEQKETDKKNKLLEIEQYNFNKQIKNLIDKFNIFLEDYENDKINRENKEDIMIKDITEKKLPKVVREIQFRDKIEQELKNNPFLGLV